MKITERLRRIRDALTTGLVERDAAIRLALLAALAGEHLLLIGPPGTAKSLVARRLRGAFVDAKYFECLLTRFTVPEELFGPLSIKQLEQDRYVRQIDHHLPSASIGFLDEIFKANSAILNALLTLLNERAFDNGGRRLKTPLISVIGASNELPEGPELAALYDRFLLRLHVGPVSDDGFDALLDAGNAASPDVDLALRLTPEDLDEFRAMIGAVELGTDVRALLKALRQWAAEQQIEISDRRWCKVARLLQASAWSHGRDVVSIWDCWLLQHCLWNEPEHRALIHEWYTQQVGVTADWAPTRLTKLVGIWEARLEADRGSRSQARDEKGRLLYAGSGGKPTAKKVSTERLTRGGLPVYAAPSVAIDRRGSQLSDRSRGGRGYTADELRDECYYKSPHYYDRVLLENWDGLDAYLADETNQLSKAGENELLMQPTPYAQAYVTDRLAKVDGLVGDLDAWLAALDGHLAAVASELSTSLWIDGAFAEPATAVLKTQREKAVTLTLRAKKAREGFAALPIRADPENDDAA